MFSFAPKSDEEIASENNFAPLPAGIYPFIVKEAAPKISKEGNNMLELKLGILTPQGSERLLTDYLLADKMAYKLKHFCEATGFSEDYKKGAINPKLLIGKAGKVNIGIQKGKMKDDGSYFSDKNSVKDYQFLAPIGSTVDPTMNDEIPF